MTARESINLTVHVVSGRWFMAFASFLIMSAAGATYIFAVFSKDIKSSLGYDQQTLNTISFFKDLGANVGIISGLLAEIAPPWVILAMGAVMNFFGYFMIYLAITGRIARPQVWQMCLYICVGANSGTFANTGALVTCVKNFPESRGIVLGLLKGFVGLSGAIFTQLYLAIYGNDSKSLVLLIAWLPAAISFLFVRTIRVMKVVRQANEFKVFCSNLYLSLLFAAYLMVVIIVQRRFTFSHAGYSASAAAVLYLLFLPLFVAVREDIKLYKAKHQTPALQSVTTDTEITTPADNDKLSEEKMQTVSLQGPVSLPPSVTQTTDKKAPNENKSMMARTHHCNRQSAQEGRGLLDPPSSVKPRLSDRLLRNDLQRRRHTDGHRQHGANRGVAGLPAAEHQHLRLPHQHMELHGSRGRGLPVGDLPRVVQVPAPPPLRSSDGALLRRQPPHRLRRARVALRGLGGHRFQLRRSDAASLRHHLRGLRAQVLRDAVQRRRPREPGGVVPAQREGGGISVRPRGPEAERRRGGGGEGVDMHGSAVLQGGLPRRDGGDGGRSSCDAGAGVEDEGVLQR